MDRRRRLERNTFFSGLTFALRISVNAVLIVIAARVLSDPEFGQYTLAISLGSLFVVLIDYGLTFFITREVAADRASAAYYLPNGAYAKVFLSIGAVLCLAIALYVLDSSRTVVYVSSVIMLSFIALSYGTFLNSVFKGMQRFEYTTITNAIQYSVLLVTQLVVLFFFPSPLGLATCFLIGRITFVAVSYRLYRRVASDHWHRPRIRHALTLLKTTSPFALYVFSSVLSLQLGTIVLAYFAGDIAVAEFQKALRFGILATAPLAIMEDAFYAFLSGEFAESIGRHRRGVLSFNKLVAAILLPLVSAVWLYGDTLLDVVYGPANSTLVSQTASVVMAAYLFLYLMPISPTLMSMGRERLNLGIWLAGAVTVIAACLILIPRYEVMGAAYALAVTYGVMKIVFLVGARSLNLKLMDRALVGGCILPQVLLFLAALLFEIPWQAGLPLLLVTTAFTIRKVLPEIDVGAWFVRRDSDR